MPAAWASVDGTAWNRLEGAVRVDGDVRLASLAQSADAVVVVGWRNVSTGPRLGDFFSEPVVLLSS